MKNPAHYAIKVPSREFVSSPSSQRTKNQAFAATFGENEIPAAQALARQEGGEVVPLPSVSYLDDNEEVYQTARRNPEPPIPVAHKARALGFPKMDPWGARQRRGAWMVRFTKDPKLPGMWLGFDRSTGRWLVSRESMKMKNPRVERLTPAEDAAWVDAFNFYLEDGKTDSQADKLAWADIQKQFARLRKASGVKAENRKRNPRRRVRRGSRRRIRTRRGRYGRFNRKKALPVPRKLGKRRARRA